MNTAIEIGKQLNHMSFQRAYALAVVAGRLKRAHIGSEELRKIEKENADDFTKIYNRFVYETNWCDHKNVIDAGDSEHQAVFCIDEGRRV